MTITWTDIVRKQLVDFLLKEDTFFLLLETGDKIIIATEDWTDRSGLTAIYTNRTSPTTTWTDRS